MALINCPECNKEISDKAVSCPNCGFPVSQVKQNNEKQNVNYDIVLTGYCQNSKIKSIKAVENECSLSLYDAKRAVENIPCVISKNINYTKAQSIQSKLESYGLYGLSVKVVPTDSCRNENAFDLSILTCPRCGSASITTGQRGFSLLTGFLGSNKTVNRCGSCGWTWEPRK